jgi:Ran GTPase-activating protein (RanGAP) involved in mRNA processing and transport
MHLVSVHVHRTISILDTNRTLKELDLSWNHLNANDMLQLAQSLAANRTLSYLNLSWNHLTTNDTGTPSFNA